MDMPMDQGVESAREIFLQVQGMDDCRRDSGILLPIIRRKGRVRLLPLTGGQVVARRADSGLNHLSRAA